MSLVTGGQSFGAGQGSELDIVSLGRYISERKKWLIIPTVTALALSFVAVNLIRPVYRSEARVLIENGDNPYTRPESDRSSSSERSGVDAEGVSSQVQLMLSRDVARTAIERLDLSKKPEFDPLLTGAVVARILGMLGLGDDISRMTPEERSMKRYFERVSAFQVEKSRVIAVQFESWDPDLAAKGANTLADLYMDAQRGAKQSATRQASNWLSSEVQQLRAKVEDAEAKVEAFRSRANLFVGSNNTSLTAQQLAEVNTQIATARAQQGDAATRARLLRDLLKSGKPIESGDVLNWETIRRLTEQKSTVNAQLAEQSSTLGPRHPRIGELRSQSQDLDQQIRLEAEKLVRSLENDARFAGARVEALNVTLEQVKKTAASANEQEVQLRVLEREAKSHRDQLEALLMRYRDASARDSINALPADARIVSRATVSNIPAFPKKIPTIIVATLGGFLISLGVLTTNAFLSGTATRPITSQPQYPQASLYPQQSYPQPGYPPGAPLQGYPAHLPGLTEPPQMPMMQPAANAPYPGAPQMPQGRSTPFSLDELVTRAASMGDAGRRVMFASIGRPDQSSEAAVALARHLIQQGRRVVLVDLNLEVRRVSSLIGGNVPGMTDLLSGTATFAQIIHRDRQSPVHIVGCGTRAMMQRDLFGDDRLAIAMHALAETYDAVIIEAGRATEMTDKLYETAGFAVLISENALSDAAAGARYRAMTAAGFADVVLMLPAMQVAA